MSAPPQPVVLHVLEALEGGTARHLVDIVRHAQGTHHEVAVPEERRGGLTDRGAIARMRDAGATVHVVPMHRTPWAPANARSLLGLRRLITDRRPDVIHGHSSIGGLLARVAGARRRTPRVYTPNGITQVRVGQLIERGLRWRTDRFVAVSASEGDLAVSMGLIGRDRLVVIPNGIELEPAPVIDLRATLGLPGDALVVGTIARLVTQKAPADFVAACTAIARAVPAAHFVLIGGGTLEAPVDAAIAAGGFAGRFHRINELPGAAGALGSFDVFALSSLFEGGPYAPLEAMRAGTAVVLTDVIGSRDAVEDGVSGRLVPVEDPPALARAVVELLGDPIGRARMAAAGQARVAEQFDVRAMGRALDALYRELA